MQLEKISIATNVKLEKLSCNLHEIGNILVATHVKLENLVTTHMKLEKSQSLPTCN
jgi:hypothetical protein